MTCAPFPTPVSDDGDTPAPCGTAAASNGSGNGSGSGSGSGIGSASGSGSRPSRKKRVPYSKFQIAELEKEFFMNSYISRKRRWELAYFLSLTERQVLGFYQTIQQKDRYTGILSHCLLERKVPGFCQSV